MLSAAPDSQNAIEYVKHTSLRERRISNWAGRDATGVAAQSKPERTIMTHVVSFSSDPGKATCKVTRKQSGLSPSLLKNPRDFGYLST